MRLKFPDDELKFPWLTMLLDAYAIVDEGVAIAVKEQGQRLNSRLACKKGCDNCCSQQDIPVYPLELVGIYWFSTEKAAPGLRGTLKKQLSGHSKGRPCPFLINSTCSIHAIRPAACRQFNVFGTACNKSEDPYHTRRHDVLMPIMDYTNRAFLTMMPFYGITDEAEKIRAIKNNFIHTTVCNLQSYEWEKLVRVMDNFDSKNP